MAKKVVKKTPEKTPKEEPKPEYIRIKFDLPRRYDWSTGKYLGHFYAEAKENKKIMGTRCPKCKEIYLPPTPVCPKCKVDMGWDWVELPQTGTVYQYTYLVFPLWDPHYGERWANPYASAIIELDNGFYYRHFLEEQDKEKLKEGMRVKAVWKEDYNERGQGPGDILYFKEIGKE
jgi:uncharacterized OB-fold protein